MKKLLFALALVPFLFASCDPKPQTLKIADFTATIPASLQVIHQEDSFPESASFYLTGEGNQFGAYSIVYYSDAELEYIEGLHEGLDNFLENKIIELLNTVVEGGFNQVFPGLEVDDFDEIEWNDDKSVAWLYMKGTHGDDQPWTGGITIYLNEGALVKLLGICNTREEYDELENIMLEIEFDEAPEGGYQTGNSAPEE